MQNSMWSLVTFDLHVVTGRLCERGEGGSGLLSVTTHHHYCTNLPLELLRLSTNIPTLQSR